MKLPKALENLYYLRLVTGNPNYAKNQALWINWCKMGFSSAIREGPPDISRDDRVRVETEPGTRWVQLRMESPKADVLKAVTTLALRVDAIKESWKGKGEADRLKALMADKEITTALVNPVMTALKGVALRAEESDRVIKAAQEGVLWLTDVDFRGLETGTWTAQESKAMAGSRVGAS